MKLLVSVRDVNEAQLAVDAAVDIVDVKEPENGALGRAAADVVKHIGTRFGERSILSVALGELKEFPVKEYSLLNEILAGFHFSKIALAGMANSDWRSRTQDFELELPTSTQLVVVSYVDHFNCQAPKPEEVIRFAIDHSMPFLLFDTYEKKQKCIFDFASVKLLSSWIDHSRQAAMQVAIAGSIRKPHLKNIRSCQPDVVGVRGAVCPEDRKGTIDRNVLRDFRDHLLHQDWVPTR